MVEKSLLSYKQNVFSQNGEDGIVERIFEVIGTTTKCCCEFGAWDGIHLSNCRQLILNGWSALLIESDLEKFVQLGKTYEGNNKVCCVNRYVDANINSLSNICKEFNIGELDFLSIDIDGLDYEIFETINIFPRVICVEVNAGHSPSKLNLFSSEVAKINIGQPLCKFSEVAKMKGYSLVSYTGNAFYIRNDILSNSNIVSLSDDEAYLDFLRFLSKEEKEWLYLVNLGLVNPYFPFQNVFLSRQNLGINLRRSIELFVKVISSWIERTIKLIVKKN